MDDPDVCYMKEALKEARNAMLINEVPVGCVLVSKEGVILSRGHNMTNCTCDATQHAEFVARGKLSKDVVVFALYVTVEPCIMCAGYLRSWKGLEKVVYGSCNDRFGGCGTVVNVLGKGAMETCHGRKEQRPNCIRGGVLADESIGVLKEFYSQENVAFAPEEKRKKKKPA